MEMSLELTVNGRRHALTVDTRQSLVYLLRETLGLTGTHVGCGTGNCGACTVILDGNTVKSCSILAVDTDGSEVLTIEGLSSGLTDLDPIQRAFAENQGLQCGYCTPGMILSTRHLLERNPDPTEAEVRRAIAGNLCRCTGYHFIVTSILEAARSMRESGAVEQETR